MGLRPGDSGGKSMTVSTVCLGLHYPAEVTFSTFPLVSSAEPMQGVACPLCIILERKACRINKEHNHLPTLQFDKQVPLISFWHVFGTSCFEAYPRLWGVGGVLTAMRYQLDSWCSRAKCSHWGVCSDQCLEVGICSELTFSRLCLYSCILLVPFPGTKYRAFL